MFKSKGQGSKLRLHSEIVYFFALLLLSFSVALIAAADLGVSMVVAPAYIISLRFPVLTFGQAEYIVQGLLFIVFCIVMKKVKLVYFSSFISCLIYGAMLDLWRAVVPVLNPEITEPGSMLLWVRIVFLVVGMVLTAVSISLCYRTYLYPQVYDFFVKGMYTKLGSDPTRTKMIFDASCLLTAIVLTLVLFRGIRGIGIATVIMTLCNGLLIGLSGKVVDRFFMIRPIWPSFAKKFDIL